MHFKLFIKPEVDLKRTGSEPKAVKKYLKDFLSKRDASLLRGLCSRPTFEPDPEPELLPLERCRSVRGAGAGRLNL